MNPKVEQVVKTVVANFAKENGISALYEPTPNSVLYGKDSLIDSIGLVTIIVEIEQMIQKEFDISISLADEKAMSLKNSPFRTVESIAEYINNLLENK